MGNRFEDFRIGIFEVIRHLKKYKGQARVGIGGPNGKHVLNVCMEGPLGLITIFPNEFTDYNRSLGEARHIDGGFIKFMGADGPNRWKGPQWSMLWFDEINLCEKDSVDSANMGLHIGARPPSAVYTGTDRRK